VFRRVTVPFLKNSNLKTQNSKHGLVFKVLFFFGGGL